nr:MAG TPA: hypothetical protein [Caudoviricetes sp.]
MHALIIILMTGASMRLRTEAIPQSLPNSSVQGLMTLPLGRCAVCFAEALKLSCSKCMTLVCSRRSVMLKQFESPIVSLTPDGTKGFIDFEGEALINEIYRTVMEHKEVEWWLITNMVGLEEFPPQHDPYYLILDIINQEWEMFRKWPDGRGIVDGTHSKGVLSDSLILKSTISMITDYHAELRLRLLASLNR